MILKLNKEIYSKVYIITAMQAYADLAQITVKDISEYWQCSFTRCRYDLQETILEFENYLIDLVNSNDFND